MDTYLRTLPLPGAVRPVREHGASALDSAPSGWPAPDPATRILDRWGMAIVAPTADWPAPDPVMRFELPAPDLDRRPTPDDRRVPRAELVEPLVAVSIPDLASVSSAAITPPLVASAVPAWPAPTLDTAAATESPDAARHRFSTRVIVAAVAAAGTVAAGAVAAVALL